MRWGWRSIPLAWCVYKANDAQAYPPQGQVQLGLNLLSYVQLGIQPKCKVGIRADWAITLSSPLITVNHSDGLARSLSRHQTKLLPDGHTICLAP